MTFKDFYNREKHVALHAQSRRFRISKYIVILSLAFLVYFWKGIGAVAFLFIALGIMGTCLHFFFRWKTKAWTQSWGLYKRIPLNND